MVAQVSRKIQSEWLSVLRIRITRKEKRLYRKTCQTGAQASSAKRKRKTRQQKKTNQTFQNSYSNSWNRSEHFARPISAASGKKTRERKTPYAILSRQFAHEAPAIEARGALPHRSGRRDSMETQRRVSRDWP